MELRLLHYFAAVCEHGSLHGAAAAVHVAQPSLSRQIRRLETELGFALFERTPRGLVLTAAGRNFLPVAQDLLLRASQAQTTASMIAKGTVSDLTVVSATTTVADIIAPTS
ncbi:LysR family transcriptional regulator [Microbacterium sp. NIBRBAC000506063]|uniref:LysR family transcriptional regulator n=1 Tax=Microbacterium sp. NIBRBAC000506063 TaxID=2734618 RepID=UPI001BB50509|nr:LysR family transcriptional regulator [Microbacterium sp. NIBRBAC000506063]QTV79944.1 LysR family transcriptional regulator [Microbacterium sp. NIBRBAC000506063]